MKDILIIPDVHGRQFWREAVDKYPDADTIFLGDYLDAYPSEKITARAVLTNFKEILKYAKSHDNCTLLLGNHDLHYLCNFGEACRLDYANFTKIQSLFLENLAHFKLLTVREVGGNSVVFSHAPLLNEWIEAVGETDRIDELMHHLNAIPEKVKTDPKEVANYLGHMSPYRGGYDAVGSPVWADVREVRQNLPESADYYIFGHTQQCNEPIITDRWACLDCRKPFLMTEGMELLPV